MKTRLTRKILLWVAVFALIGAGLLGRPLFSKIWLGLKPTSQFVPYPSEPRVLYEPGAEAMARVAAEALPAAIQKVEAALGRPFVDLPKIHVCATMESFNSYDGRGRRGFVYGQRLFISPRSDQTLDRLPWLIAHELVHLHVQQNRWRVLRLFSAPDPGWFMEGLAMWAAKENGPDFATEAEAWRAIAEGRHFVAKSDAELGQAMGYRQGGMFIAFLHDQDPQRFKTFLFATESGQSAYTALASAYGENFESLWAKFLTEARRRVGS